MLYLVIDDGRTRAAPRRRRGDPTCIRRRRIRTLEMSANASRFRWTMLYHSLPPEEHHGKYRVRYQHCDGTLSQWWLKQGDVKKEEGEEVRWRNFIVARARPYS